MPKFITIEEAEKRKLAENGTLSLIDNDRPLSEAELEAETKAIRFSKKEYPSIVPISGTLGFLLRNLQGGNASVVEFLKESSEVNSTKFIKNFLTLWNVMDEYSKKRIDLWDILCAKFSIKRKKFWGVIQEGMFDHNDALSQIALSGKKAAFIDLLWRMSKLPKNNKDRQLLAEALGITKDTPLISMTDNSIHETTNNTKIEISASLPSFASSMRRIDKFGKSLEVTKEVLALPESKQEYIEGEIVKEDERILVNR